MSTAIYSVSNITYTGSNHMIMEHVKATLVETSAGYMYALKILKGTELAHKTGLEAGRFSVTRHQRKLSRYGIC